MRRVDDLFFKYPLFLFILTKKTVKYKIISLQIERLILILLYFQLLSCEKQMDPQKEQAIDLRFVKKEEQKSSSEKNSSISDIEEMQANETQGQPWTDQENTIFAIFILHYHDIFKSKRKRKSIRIFKILSQFLKSRKPRQCRSHFQKQMIKHNKNIDRIVEYFKTRDKNFLSIYQNLKASLPEVKSQEKIKMMDKGIQVNLDMQQMQWMKHQSMEIYAPPQYFYPYMDGVYAVTWPGVPEATQCYYKF